MQVSCISVISVKKLSVSVGQFVIINFNGLYVSMRLNNYPWKYPWIIIRCEKIWWCSNLNWEVGWDPFLMVFSYSMHWPQLFVQFFLAVAETFLLWTITATFFPSVPILVEVWLSFCERIQSAVKVLCHLSIILPQLHMILSRQSSFKLWGRCMDVSWCNIPHSILTCSW